MVIKSGYTRPSQRNIVNKSSVNTVNEVPKTEKRLESKLNFKSLTKEEYDLMFKTKKD